MNDPMTGDTMTMTATPASRPSGRHPVNIGHLVMGLAFLGLVGIWALVQSDLVAGDEIRWLLPVPWVLAGIAGLVATAVTGTRRYAIRQTGWVDSDSNRTDPQQAEEPDETDETEEIAEADEIEETGQTEETR